MVKLEPVSAGQHKKKKKKGHKSDRQVCHFTMLKAILNGFKPPAEAITRFRAGRNDTEQILALSITENGIILRAVYYGTHDANSYLENKPTPPS